jgi:hypothetical protein
MDRKAVPDEPPSGAGLSASRDPFMDPGTSEYPPASINVLEQPLLRV